MSARGTRGDAAGRSPAFLAPLSEGSRGVAAMSGPAGWLRARQSRRLNRGAKKKKPNRGIQTKRRQRGDDARRRRASARGGSSRGEARARARDRIDVLLLVLARAEPVAGHVLRRRVRGRLVRRSRARRRGVVVARAAARLRSRDDDARGERDLQRRGLRRRGRLQEPAPRHRGGLNVRVPLREHRARPRACSARLQLCSSVNRAKPRSEL